MHRFILSFVVLFGLCGVIGWSNSKPSERPRVVFFYTSHSPYPEFVFRLSGFPLALASLIKFGPHQFSMTHATWKNVKKAMQDAEFVVIGSHGYNGGILTDEGGLLEPLHIEKNVEMKHVYFGSCYFGKRRLEWQQRFPNAKILGYDDLTYPAVGWRYLVFNSWWDLLDM